MLGLERLLLRLLEEYAGPYVQSLNREQLKVGLLKGKLVLRDVRLRRDALEALGLPLDVVDGVAREVTVHVPWAKLGTERVRIEVRGLAARVQPGRVEGKSLDEGRRSRLAAAEMLTCQLQGENEEDLVDDAAGDSPGGHRRKPAKPRTRRGTKKKESLRSKLLQKMLDNVSVEVSDVAITYVDSLTCVEPVSLTLHVGELCVETVDPESRRQAFFSRSSGGAIAPLRLTRVKDMALHCPVDPEAATPSAESRVLHVAGMEAVYVAPSSGAARDLLGAAQCCRLRLGVVAVHATAAQVGAVSAMSNAILNARRYALLRDCERERPAQSPKEAPASWWRFAVHKVLLSRAAGLRQKRPPLVGRALLAAFRQRTAYLALYRRKLDVLMDLVAAGPGAGDSQPDQRDVLAEAMPPGWMDALESLEAELDVQTVLLFRHMALQTRTLADGDLPDAGQEDENGPAAAAAAAAVAAAAADVTRAGPGQRSGTIRRRAAAPVRWLASGFKKSKAGTAQADQLTVVWGLPSSREQELCEAALAQQGGVEPAELEVLSYAAPQGIAAAHFSLHIQGFQADLAEAEAAIRVLSGPLALDLERSALGGDWEVEFAFSELAIEASDGKQTLLSAECARGTKPFASRAEVVLQRLADATQAAAADAAISAARSGSGSFSLNSSFSRTSSRRRSSVTNSVAAATPEPLLDDPLPCWAAFRVASSRGVVHVRLRLETLALPAAARLGDALALLGAARPQLSARWAEESTESREDLGEVLLARTNVDLHVSNFQATVALPSSHALRLACRELALATTCFSGDENDEPSVHRLSLEDLDADFVHGETQWPLLQGYQASMLFKSCASGLSLRGSLPAATLHIPLELVVWARACAAEAQALALPSTDSNITWLRGVDFSAPVLELVCAGTGPSWTLRLSDAKLSLSRVSGRPELELKAGGAELLSNAACCFVSAPAPMVVKRELGRGVQMRIHRVDVQWDKAIVAQLVAWVQSTAPAGSGAVTPESMVRGADVVVNDFSATLLDTGGSTACYSLQGELAFQDAELSLFKPSLRACAAGLELFETHRCATAAKRDAVARTLGVSWREGRGLALTAKGIEYLHIQDTWLDLRARVEADLAAPLRDLLTPQGGGGGGGGALQPVCLLEDCTLAVPASRSAALHRSMHGRLEFRVGALTANTTNAGMDVSIVRPGIATRYAGAPAAQVLAQALDRRIGLRLTTHPGQGGAIEAEAHWTFDGSPLELCVMQEQFNLFEIVLGENLTDWRTAPHTCVPLAWASEAAVNPCERCDEAGDGKGMRSSTQTLIFPDHLAVRLQLASDDEPRFLLRAERYKVELKEFQRGGRQVLHRGDALAVHDLQSPCKPAIETVLEIPAQFSLQSTKCRAGDVEVCAETRAAHVTADVSALQRLSGFLDGNLSQRVAMGCPTAFGPDPATERRPKGVQTELRVSQVSIELSDGLPVEAHDVRMTRHRTRAELRELELELQWARVGDPNVLERPVRVTFHRSVVSGSNQKQRRESLSVAEVFLCATHAQGRQMLLAMERWRTKVALPGRKGLRKLRRRRYEVQDKIIEQLESRSVLHSQGLQLLVTDIAREAGVDAVPLVKLCASPLIAREVVQTLASSGRKVATYETDFTDWTAPGGSLSGAVHRGAQDAVWCGASSRRGVVAAYYNLRIAKWEPLLEPWSFEWTVQHTSSFATKEASAVAVQLHAARPLNVNFSFEACKTLSWCIAAARATEHRGSRFAAGPGSAAADGVAPPEQGHTTGRYLIENRTGTLVSFSALGGACEEPRELAQGSRAAFEPPDTRGDSGASATPALVLHWPGDEEHSWHVLNGVRVDKVGTFVYTLHPRFRASLGEEPTSSTMLSRLVVDVQPLGGFMLVRLRSALQLRNTLEDAVEVLLLPSVDPITHHQCASTAQVFGPVPAGQVLHLPLHATRCSLTLRPVRAGREFDWWEGLDLRVLEHVEAEGGTAQAKSFLISCDETGQEDAGQYCACLHALPTEASNAKRSKHVHQLVVRPCLVVENLLPVAIDMQAASGARDAADRAQDPRHALAKGPCRVVAAGDLHSWSLPHESWLRFRSSASEWSAPWRVGLGDASAINLSKAGAVSPFAAPEGTVSSGYFTLADRLGGRPLRVLVEVDRPSAHCCRVTLYTGCWLLNRTGLALSYAVGQVKKAGSSRGSKLDFGQGELVDVRTVVLAQTRWQNGVVFQVNSRRGTYDVLFTTGRLELDVLPARVRAAAEHRADECAEHDVVGSDAGEPTDVDTDEEQAEWRPGVHADAAGVVESVDHDERDERDDAGLEALEMFSDSNHLSVRAVDSSWSEAFNVGTVGTKGSLLLTQRDLRSGRRRRCHYELGVKVSLAPGRFRRTKVVTFMPRFVMVTDFEAGSLGPGGHLLVAQSVDLHKGVPRTGTLVRLEASEARPLLSFAGSDEWQSGAITLRIESGGQENWEWSGAISILQEAVSAIKLRCAASGRVRVLRLTVEVSDATSIVRVGDEEGPGRALYRVENQSAEAIVHYFQHVGQAKRSALSPTSGPEASRHTEAAHESSVEGSSSPGLERLGSVPAEARGVVERLLPGESRAFGWDQLNLARRIIVLSLRGDSAYVACDVEQLDLSGTLPPPIGLALRTGFDGSTKVLTICDAAAGVGDPPDSATSFDEAGPEAAASSIVVHVALSSVSLSVVDNFPQELVLLSAGDVVLDFFQQPSMDRSIELRAKWIQADNQLLEARLPVLMTPREGGPRGTSEAPREASAGPPRPPFLHVSVVQRGVLDRDKRQQCLLLEYVGVAVQEFDLKVEMKLVLFLWRLAAECRSVWHACVEQSALARSTAEQAPERDGSVLLCNWLREELAENRPAWLARRGATAARRSLWYVERLELHPIKAVVTVQSLVEDPRDLLDFGRSRPGGAAAHVSAELVDDRHFDPNSILTALPPAISHVEGATLLVSALMLRSSILTHEQAARRVARHFSSQALSQLYRIVGSSELLGNPVGLVTNLGIGLRDLFYEPALGLVESPEAFGAGLVRGTRNFVQHTTVGTFNSFSKLTSSIGSGVAQLSMDSRYIAGRRAALLDESPRHLGDGVMLGAKSLGEGLTGGISGVVMEPLRGAEEDGVGGFFLGVGRGILGVAVKPAVGVFDLVASLFAGVRSTAALLDARDFEPVRCRLPRALRSSLRSLECFDPPSAFVQALMVETWGARAVRRGSQYVGHLPLPGHMVLVHTGHTLGCIDYSSFRRGVRSPLLLWSVDTRTVLSVGLGAATVEDVARPCVQVRLSDETKAECRAAPACAQLLRQAGERPAELLVLAEHESLLAVEQAFVVATKWNASDLVGERAQRPPLGLNLCPLPRHESHQRARARIWDTAGVPVGVGLVASVEKGSLAARAGVMEGDYLVAVGGSALEPGEYGDVVNEAVAELPPGAIMELALWRGGKWLTLRLRLDAIRESSRGSNSSSSSSSSSSSRKT